MAILKSTHISEAVARRATISSIPTSDPPWGRKYMWVKIPAKYGNFENRPVFRAACRAKEAQFRPTGVEREYICNF